MTMGYLNNPEATKALYTVDEYMHTGELNIVNSVCLNMCQRSGEK